MTNLESFEGWESFRNEHKTGINHMAFKRTGRIEMLQKTEIGSIKRSIRWEKQWQRGREREIESAEERERVRKIKK